MGSLRIFIACADERLRLALFVLLDDSPGMTVVGVSDRSTGLLAQLAGSEPSVLILDSELSGQPIADLIAEIDGIEGRPILIVLSTRPEEKELFLAAGADYFICKDAPPDSLLPILRGIQESDAQPTKEETISRSNRES